MFRKAKTEVTPGSLSETPATSRKILKAAGVSAKDLQALLETELRTRPRWRVVRHPMSAGHAREPGFVVLGDVSVIFATGDTAIRFSHPYQDFVKWGVQDASATDLYWLVQDGGQLLRYVFTVEQAGAGTPADTTPLEFLLEELDRAMLESQRRRFTLKQSQTLTSSGRLALLSPRDPIKDSKIVSMMVEDADPVVRLSDVPRHIHEDRYYCEWISWSDTAGIALLKKREEKALVTLIPLRAGLLMLNPCSEGHAQFLGECVPFSFALLKSWGDTKTQFSFRARRALNAPEECFVLSTERATELSERVTHLNEAYHTARGPTPLFPKSWPPLRYNKEGDNNNNNNNPSNAGGSAQVPPGFSLAPM